MTTGVGDFLVRFLVVVVLATGADLATALAISGIDDANRSGTGGDE
jgi:hypothetical protein